MIYSTVQTISQAYSGQAAKDDVAAVIGHHRIQASPGYRAAAGYVLQGLQDAGLEAHIERYPADFRSKFWTAGSFQEWNANGATLHLIEPEEEARKLADYREMKLSLIQRSTSFSGEAEVVLLEDGLKESDYQGLDVAGKIVFTKGPVEQVRQLAVDARGAIGIIYDGMRTAPPVREPMDLPDAREYTSFWWTGMPGEKRCFGFVLSPRQGAWLRRLIRRLEADGSPPLKVRAQVEAGLYDGSMEVVTALIPGKSRQTVVLASHLCHPQPSANDNASGVAANLEAARTLQRLIAAGELPPPQRNIRFLWMPEMTGTYAYLSGHEDEIPTMIAGLNLDMVGEDQSQTGSVLLLERPPDAAASFAPDLLARLYEHAFNDVKSHGGLGSYSLFRYKTTPFSGGSDHYIFSDPTVGVPMPMMIQWPDKFYHTSADTLDKVSPESLARAGTVAAAYTYFIAAAGRREATWLAYEMLSRYQVRLSRLVQDQITELWQDGGREARELLAALERRVTYGLERHHQALQSIGRLWEGAGPLVESIHDHAGRFARQELERARLAADQPYPGWREKAAEPLGSSEQEAGGKWEGSAAEAIPRRNYRGPGMTIGAMARLSPADRTAWRELFNSRKAGAYTMLSLAEYWADGRRSVLEIVQLVEMETGIRDAELIGRYFEVLEKLGLVTFD